MRILLLFSIFYCSTLLSAQTYPEIFSDLDGWKAQGEKQYFDRDYLHDYINDASDVYFGYDFQDLWVVDYKNGEGQMVKLELYRHATPLQAFGIYTEERPQWAKVQEIGAQGFYDNGIVYFLANDYYVKVFNGRPEVEIENLITFSKIVALSVCDNCGLPQPFDFFPKKDRIANSERYISENFMGISGFNGVCTVEYKYNGEEVRLFAYQASEEKCRQVLQKYFSRLNYKKKPKSKLYQFDDPNFGKVSLVFKNGGIYGLLDATHPDEEMNLLNLLVEKALK